MAPEVGSARGAQRMAAVSEGAATCPRCGAQIAQDRGCVAWCRRCDWNVDPLPPRALPTRKADRVAARVDADAERALALAAGARDHSTRDRVVEMFPVLIALGVHLVSLVVVLAGLYLVLVPGGVLAILFGVLLVSAAVLLRPHLGRISKRDVTVTRATAPELFGLLDEIALAASARPVQLVVLNGDFNAAYGSVGLRRRRVVWIGVPLWLVLAPDERLALLSHEIAHQVNGDARRGLLVGTSIESLASWYQAFKWTHDAEGGLGPVDYLSWLLSLPLAKAIQLTLRLQLRLTARSHRRAEFAADDLAAEIASTGAVLALLDVSLLSTPCLRALQHDSRHGDGALWDLLVTWRGGLPGGEWERLRRADRLRGASVDASHPPTAHRVDALRALSDRSGKLVLGADRSRRIDVAEILPASRMVERRLRDWLESDRVVV